MRVTEAARLLGVHTNTIRNWVAQGRLRDVRPQGAAQIRLDPEQVATMVVRRPTVEHGTNRGYDHHVRHGEPACAPCLEAHATYVRNWRNDRRTPDAVASRNRYEAARQRALSRLRQAHPEQFADLLREELTR